jgi:putative addiction module component (TIGR02574 family)
MLTLDEIKTEALRLPENDRAQLFSTLLLSFGETPEEEEHTRAWAEEALRRDQAMDSGEEPGIPAEEVFRELRSTLR